MESQWWSGLQPFLWLVTFRTVFEALNAVLNAAFWLCPYYVSAKGVLKRAQEEKKIQTYSSSSVYACAYCFRRGKGKRRTWKKHWHNIKKKEWEGPKSCTPGEKKEFDPCNDQHAPTAIKSRSKNAQTPCPHPYILDDASKFSS